MKIFYKLAAIVQNISRETKLIRLGVEGSKKMSSIRAYQPYNRIFIFLLDQKNETKKIKNENQPDFFLSHKPSSSQPKKIRFALFVHAHPLIANLVLFKYLESYFNPLVHKLHPIKTQS
jgi:hypothetical protein